MRARADFELISRELLGLWTRPGGSRRSVLRCATLALDSSAVVWHTLGPAAGERHLHLLRRLEDALAAVDRQIRAAEIPVLVNRSMVSLVARTACAAIDELAGGESDRAQALAVLEDAAVDLAALAVRIALNLNEIGSVIRGLPRPAGLESELDALASQVGVLASEKRWAIEREGGEDHVGVWLGALVVIAPPRDALELAGRDGEDGCLAAEALLSIRARWMELAVALWLIVEQLDRLTAIETFGGGRLQRVATSRASGAIVACGLCREPGGFEHGEAWRLHRDALNMLVCDVCLAVQTAEPDAVVRSQQLVLRRLARVLAAVWAIDEHMRSPAGRSGRRCR